MSLFDSVGSSTSMTLPVADRIKPVEMSSITLKINGLTYLLDPVKQMALPRPMVLIPSAARPGLVIQTFFQLRDETPTADKLETEETFYRIELNESESLDSEEEFQETLEEEEAEPLERAEEVESSEIAISLEEGEGFGEEEPKESSQELESFIEDEKKKKALKMWKKAREEILAQLQKKRPKKSFVRFEAKTLVYDLFFRN